MIGRLHGRINPAEEIALLRGTFEIDPQPALPLKEKGKGFIIAPAADRAAFFASYAVEPFAAVRRRFFKLPSLPVRAAGRLLSPEVKEKIRRKLKK